MKVAVVLVMGLIGSWDLFGAISLKKAFFAASGNMETLKQAKVQIKRSKDQKRQALGNLLPSLSAVGSYTKIDPPDAAGRNPFLLTEQYSAAFELRQPLLRGGALAAYHLASENILLSKFQKEATSHNLYQLVINAYFNLSMAQLDVQNVEKLLQFSRERVKEIKERTLIGRSRKGELVQAEAQFFTAKSQFEQVKLNLKESKERLEFLTGMESLQSEEVMVASTVPDLKGSLDELLMKVKSRPDILASLQQVQVANKQVAIAKGGHYPQVDLVSRYYLERTGILETSNWDVGASVSIPLYQGGTVDAQVRQALHEKRIAELGQMETLRAAERDVRISYQSITQIKEQLKSLALALKKAEEVYRLNKKDYKLGLVTNLDVLGSLNSFIETKRTFDNLIALGNMHFRHLEALTGVLP